MELIERYISEVTRRISKKNRQDIAMELRSTIEDMLPDHYSEKEVTEVLQELGDPARLASQYEDKKQYLIGPLFFDRYISFLKVVGLPIAILIFLSEWMSGIVSSNGEIMMKASMMQIFWGMFITIVNSIVHLFFWITIVFVVIERFAKSNDSKSWTPEDLWVTAIPVQKQISKFEVFSSLFWTILWVAALFYAGWYRQNNGTSIYYFLFNQEELVTYIPAIIGVVAVEIGLAIYMLVAAKWTKVLVGFNGVSHIIFAVLLCVMVSNPNLFNQQFIEVFLHMGIDSTNWLTIIWGTVGLTIASLIYDIVKSIQAWRAPNPMIDYQKHTSIQ
jgi:hypothetical protein